VHSRILRKKKRRSLGKGSRTTERGGSNQSTRGTGGWLPPLQWEKNNHGVKGGNRGLYLDNIEKKPKKTKGRR